MPAVMTFYRFVHLPELAELRKTLESRAAALDLRGTILLAQEGINGTLSGEQPMLERFRDHLHGHTAFTELHCRFSTAAEGNPVFYRLKVRIKPEIVRLDQPGIAPQQRTGERVNAQRWNALLDDPEVTIIDTRNAYEIAIGTFPGALNPQTRSFRELPAYVAQHLDPARHRRVAMFCTGGIRCEKASAWLLEQGFGTVYQLDGGILTYLETVSDEENRWRGECFVFDQRVSVDTGLGEGSFQQCFACRRPLAPADLESEAYQPGVSCPHCAGEHSEGQREAFRERRRQVELAAARGERHVGPGHPASCGNDV